MTQTKLSPGVCSGPGGNDLKPRVAEIKLIGILERHIHIGRVRALQPRTDQLINMLSYSDPRAL